MYRSRNIDCVHRLPDPHDPSYASIRIERLGAVVDDTFKVTFWKRHGGCDGYFTTHEARLDELSLQWEKDGYKVEHFSPSFVRLSR